jgi:tetratricopeptide (TPR) repeat protein
VSRRLRPLVLLAGLALLGACAPAVRLRVPAGEDYVFPSVRPGELQPEEARALEAAWRKVLEGDALGAEREFERLLRRRPGLPAAAAGVGYARLRAGRTRDALLAFETALRSDPDYLPALVGAGGAALRGGAPEAALEYLRRAQGVAPADATVRNCLGDAKLAVTESRVAAARAARERGEQATAAASYAAALEAAPELADVRLELAELLREQGDEAGALDLLEQDPTDDRRTLLRLGALLQQRAEWPRAVDAYRRLLARDPRDAEALAGASAARREYELSQMPPEYQRIFTSPRLTRADLAALLAVKVTALARLEGPGPEVAVDISGSWAREHILRVLALDIMDVYPNHTFQPAATVRRGDLAHAVARVLDLLRQPRAADPVLKDMSANNLFHAAAARVVAAGLMDTTPGGAFEPWRPVSGPESVDVIENLVRLVGP